MMSTRLVAVSDAGPVRKVLIGTTTIVGHTSNSVKPRALDHSKRASDSKLLSGTSLPRHVVAGGHAPAVGKANVGTPFSQSPSLAEVRDLDGAQERRLVLGDSIDSGAVVEQQALELLRALPPVPV
jgi:hypothetical protein